ncbi:aldo/keto reductase [Pseudarthrobacter sulfonivorans]|uniref:aldo/keto reductase n=1 Tax=Pseudarthrobacter sulfonivorans TaxID=121292 RepID=UPI000AC6A7FB|nr:aldo/keto reductase [Pseudarthrobacter sulfonivorans]
MSLRRLGVDRIDLFQLHRIDPDTALEDQVGELKKVPGRRQDPAHRPQRGHHGEAEAALKIAPIVSVQNLYDLTDRSPEELLDWSTEKGIGFIPWFPLATGRLTGEGSPLSELDKQHDASPSQLALAWLLKRSPVLLPIPRKSSVGHLEDNLTSATIELTDDEFEALSKAAAQLPSSTPRFAPSTAPGADVCVQQAESTQISQIFGTKCPSLCMEQMDVPRTEDSLPLAP